MSSLTEEIRDSAKHQCTAALSASKPAQAYAAFPWSPKGVREMFGICSQDRRVVVHL
jgi:hypothetical protein